MPATLRRHISSSASCKKLSAREHQQMLPSTPSGPFPATLCTIQPSAPTRERENGRTPTGTRPTVIVTALDAIPDLPVMKELDNPPAMKELSKAINCLACVKSPGCDGIPPEILRSLRWEQDLASHNYPESQCGFRAGRSTYAFKDCSEGVYIHTRTHGKLYNLVRFRAKTKVTEALIQTSPNIAIDGFTLEVVENFTYLESTISSSLSIYVKINSRVAKAATVMAKLNQRVWNNSRLTEKTKLCVCQSCVLSTLLYRSETWKRNNSFHILRLRRILQIKWQDQVPEAEVLERANINSLQIIFSERRPVWQDSGHRPNPQRPDKLAVF
ncbi:hypothetical protein RRG08_066057 [Elysia crispata]|uniref:Reverse transcriptase n=1 Tax=Elysia crispata TaxID=231223 RepID=A0AAE1CRM2_9GAST|nr:hypothetical protein RRG08_066057 [Elysia crispata]